MRQRSTVRRLRNQTIIEIAVRCKVEKGKTTDKKGQVMSTGIELNFTGGTTTQTTHNQQ